MSGEKLFWIAAGCAIGNFVYAAIKSRDWERAADTSFMQAIPIIVIWLAQ